MPQFNPFPVGYQPYNGGYQYQYQPQQIPVNNWNMPSGQMPQQNPPVQQDMTPVIHMDIKQVEPFLFLFHLNELRSLKVISLMTK